MSFTARQVVEALKHRYIGEGTGTANVTSEDVIAFLKSLSPDEIRDDFSLLENISGTNPDWIPPAAEIAVLHSVKDCMNMIFKLVDLEDQITAKLRALAPALAAEIISDPALPFSEEVSLLSNLDLLLDATIGWSSDQGRAGEKLLAEVEKTINALRESDGDSASVHAEFSAFLEKDQSRIRKLEERLAASESGKLRSQRGRTVAAEMINETARNKQMTESMVSFLRGPWYESMQLLAINKGVEGDDWVRAAKLTETIVWTYQPADDEDDKQRLYRILEHLPAEIRDLLLALEHNAGEAEEAMEAIEADHVAIVSGQELDYQEFQPLDVQGSALTQRTSISRVLLKKVNGLNPGQWFTYEDADRSTRIKLVLKLEDVRQMMFTNRSGMKALEKSFEELAYLMSSSVIKVLNHDAVFTNTYRTVYTGFVEEHQRKLKAAEEADQEAARKEAARQKALKEAEALARAREEAEKERLAREKEERLAEAREVAAQAENQARVSEFKDTVNTMNIGAWLKLPAADGELEECKLAVRVASADKFIFVNRNGIKTGEFTGEQLISLLVAGQAHIQDTGVEFEDTLAQVVSKLRQDRNKSYDDLTGK